MAEPVKRNATYADLEAVPPHLVAEIIDGELLTHPRPSPRHGFAASALNAKLGNYFQFNGDEPNGWIFIVEPELHLEHHVVVPDVAGWRRKRLPIVPARNSLLISPDWVCEILSASTEKRDRTIKMQIYAEAGIPHLWLIDPRQQILEAFELRAGRWLKIGAWNSDDEVRALPFDAIAFSLADLWPLDRPLGFQDDPLPLYAGDR